MGNPPVIRSAWVNRPIGQAFSVFTDEIGAWWPLPTHGIFGAESGAVSFEDELLVERSTDGSEVIWGEVTNWDPPHRLAIAWHPGRTADETSVVNISFTVEGDGTTVTIEHRGWETFGHDAAKRRLGYVGPNAWGYVLDHFADGAEVRPDATGVAGLMAAYGDFYNEAEGGEFGEAPAGEWDAFETLAHVALNDLAMLAVTQAIVHDTGAASSALTFENVECHDPDALRRWIESSRNLDGLIGRGRGLARLVSASLQRLSPAQLETMVHCRLHHDGEVMLDRPMPWGAVAVSTQSDMHLPAHVRQLQNLRV